MNGFTNQKPKSPGVYEIRCWETGDESSKVVLRGDGKGGLDVFDEDIGQVDLETYIANLTDVTWRKLR